MPTILGPKYSIDWRGKPPHMLKVDIPIWYRFLEKYGSQFNSLYYDCLLGGPHLTPREEKDPLLRMWRFNTSKRADVIVETKDEVWIIEVTSEPKVRALGQLMMYKRLWKEDPKSNKSLKVVLVCDRVDADVVAASSTYGVETYVV